MAEPRVMTREELRALDRVAVEEMGVPSILLMENAAIGATRVVTRALDVLEPGPVVVIAGIGNNGGDGLAMARQLHLRGYGVHVLIVGRRDRLAVDAAVNLRALETCNVRPWWGDDQDANVVYQEVLSRCVALTPAVVVDGLLGTGLSRDVEGAALGAIRAINEARKTGSARFVVALDLPSGLDADTGRPLGAAVRADATVTFAALKMGFFTLEAQPFVGEIELCPIGVPPELTARFGVPYDEENAVPDRLDARNGGPGGYDPSGVGRDAGAVESGGGDR